MEPNITHNVLTLLNEIPEFVLSTLENMQVNTCGENTVAKQQGKMDAKHKLANDWVFIGSHQVTGVIYMDSKAQVTEKTIHSCQEYQHLPQICC